MGAPSVHQVALACGTGGAYVDVSAYVISSEVLTQSWGRSSSFEDVQPRVFSFTLDNATGPFTPDNAAISPVVTTLTEGMGACWNVGGRLVSGTIRTVDPSFASSLAISMRVRITCDDALGTLARTNLSDAGSFARAMALASAYFYWPLTDDATSGYAAEVTGNNGPSLRINSCYLGPLATFGIPGVPAGNGDTQVDVTYLVPDLYALDSSPNTLPPVAYSGTSLGAWGIWCTPISGIGAGGGYLEVQIPWAAGVNGVVGFDMGIDSTGFFFVRGFDLVTLYSAVTPVAGVPHYLAVTVTRTSSATITFTFYVDDVSQGTLAYTPSGGVPSVAYATPSRVSILPVPAAGEVRFSHLSHTSIRLLEAAAGQNVESGRVAAIVATNPTVTLGTLPALSTALLGASDVSGSALDALNDVVRTEQGHLSTVTTGTLTAPAQTVVLRALDRPLAVSAVFSLVNDIIDAPEFIRTLSNTLSAVTVKGPDKSVQVADPTLANRGGSGSENVLFENAVDLSAWGQDRLLRGKVRGLAIASFTVDAFTTTSDRWAALTALVAGDRVQVSDLPVQQLGFSTWDGWIVGGSDSHTEESHLFTFLVMPVLPPAGVYDTDLYASGGLARIGVAAGSGSTSIITTIQDNLSFFERVAVPYTLQIESEQLTLTAAAAPIGNSQTITVTRGVNGTAAVAHAKDVVIEIASTTNIYAL